MATVNTNVFEGSHWDALGMQFVQPKPLGRNPPDDNFPAVVGDDNLRLIGLSGKARSGKDTIGQILKDEFKVVRFSFAEAIRDGVKAMFGLSDAYFDGELKEAEVPWIGKSPRQIMQTLGTDWGRSLIHEDIWLKIVERKIEDARYNYQHVVITDVRFENEAALIRKLGGEMWHVRRSNAASVNSHASEAGILFHPNVDKLIFNNGTLSQLAEDVIDEF